MRVGFVELMEYVMRFVICPTSYIKHTKKEICMKKRATKHHTVSSSCKILAVLESTLVTKSLRASGIHLCKCLVLLLPLSRVSHSKPLAENFSNILKRHAPDFWEAEYDK